MWSHNTASELHSKFTQSCMWLVTGYSYLLEKEDKFFIYNCDRPKVKLTLSLVEVQNVHVGIHPPPNPGYSKDLHKAMKKIDTRRHSIKKQGLSFPAKISS